MPLDDPAILAALWGSHDVEAVCRAAGVAPAAFAAARDVLLRRLATLTDTTLTAAVGVPVTIRRDRAGVPHIAAARTPDLFFGLGLAMAQDRLWQMDRLRRRALGRQAEILGPAYADSDAAHLTVGIDRIAEREASAMDEATASLIAAFVAGINRWIEAAATRCRSSLRCSVRTRAVYHPRHRRHRPRRLVVAEWPHRPHRRR